MSKPIIYLGRKIQKEIDQSPEDVRDRINFELVALQEGQPSSFEYHTYNDPEDDSKYPPVVHKNMKETIGKHARQFTIKSQDSYRIIYVSVHKEAIYVLHFFKKKTEGVSPKEYNTAHQRYKNLEQHRKSL
ncbi:type II toxin-antitoxin system RelE/ParE family toxin [Endozoicomonas sp. SM1973]|uniref:Type II toxin-antitoxin system RelE/ParE family toxin n=1 Tax=Spartinivicinus marinus TaxID=2994442 RepID=A0A853IIR1_9GAMM|nr:type II toxin-antitoxin system RelE/ParE family toxin [Spartinivicinus marinus]MCX4027918.1 type II toxin-antitoxin system RelE/ParE family toxin [Spartinivicinus marinus]NYZ69961.1 type II toxin-antitoxin system RelE/ParE family toxin [Spartinivicinus marinus]